MLNFLFILLMSGCMSNKRMLNGAKNYMNGVNCYKKIERKLDDNHCTNLEIYRDDVQVVFRCMKVDRERKNIWDTWWFRITSPLLRIPPELILKIEEHTICIDAQIRLEAYPPEDEK